MSQFDIHQLTSLSLQKCPGTDLLLQGMVESEHSQQLRRIEFIMEDYPYGNQSAIVSFLQYFQGLEDVLIMVRPHLESIDSLKAILNHKTSLKTLVYHERNVDTNNSFRCYNEFLDWNLTYNLNEREHSLADLDFFQCFFSEMSLHYLGLRDFPRMLKSKIMSSAAHQTLKILHIRISASEVSSFELDSVTEWIKLGGPDRSSEDENPEGQKQILQVFDFAQRAFGTDGFPNLRIQAFGDFPTTLASPGQVRYSLEPHYQYRKDTPQLAFRVLAKGETAPLDGIDQPFDFLGACPKDALLYKAKSWEYWPG